MIQPTFVEVDAKTPEGLFGLVPESTKKFFVEVNGLIDPTPQTSRFLIQFSSTEIDEIIDNKISGSQWQTTMDVKSLTRP